MFQTEEYGWHYPDAGFSSGGKASAKLAHLSKRIHRVRTDDNVSLSYYWFQSSQPRPDLPLFFAVHGIGRRAKDQARMFAPYVEAIGGTLIAPIFGKRRFAGYQRLKRSQNEIRSDLAARELILHAHHRFEMPSGPVVMFGYSGGGQFVHRFAMAYPRQVKRIAIAAPGWFTFPDKRIRFPQGISEISTLPDLNFDSSRFLRIPSLVLVGDRDVGRGKSLNQRREIDAQQGRHRLERAGKWVNAMRSAAGRYQYNTVFQLQILPGCAHSFADCMETGEMGWPVVRFLFEGYL